MSKQKTNTTSFSQICNTAILRSGITNNKGIRDALVRLFVTLIEHKKYDLFSKETFIKDFIDFYSLPINAMMFGEVLPDLLKKGIIKKKEKDVFIVKKETLSNLNYLKGYEDFIRQSDLLVDKFVDYAHALRCEMSKKDAMRVLSTYIEESICSLGMDSSSPEKLNDEEEYLVATFIGDVRANQPSYYEIFENILVGRMLASFITNGGKTTEESVSAFLKTTIYLDTAFLFNLLGLNDYSTPSEYLELVESLKKMGAKIRIFDHTYSETYDIIETTISWLNNSDYSLEKASQVNNHFIVRNCTKEDIEEYLYTLKTRLSKLGISIEETNIDYNEDDSLFQNDIKIKIVEEYRKNGSYAENKDMTYDLDAKSLYAIYKRRKGKICRRLEDAGYLFLTTNRAIARVSRQIGDERGAGRFVPLAITDTFLSVLLFFASPDYSSDVNERFCVPAAFHAFEPGRELIKKVELVLSEIQNKGLITQNDVFSWKTSGELMGYIVKETKNNPDNFDEKTPAKIMEQIRREADERIGHQKAESQRQIEVAFSEANQLVAHANEKADKEAQEKQELLRRLDETEKTNEALLKILIDDREREKKRLVLERDAIIKSIETSASRVYWIVWTAGLIICVALVAFLLWLADYLRSTENLHFRTISYFISGLLAIIAVASFPAFLGRLVKRWIVSSMRKKRDSDIKQLEKQIEECESNIKELKSQLPNQ